MTGQDILGRRGLEYAMFEGECIDGGTASTKDDVGGHGAAEASLGMDGQQTMTYNTACLSLAD